MTTKSNIEKMILWKRTDRSRSSWEKRWTALCKHVLNKQFKDLSIRIDETNYKDSSLIDSVITQDSIEKMITGIYTTVGVDFAREQYGRMKEQHKSLRLKSDPEDEWMESMRNYARTRAGKKIVSITASSREQAIKIIQAVIEQSTNEGWGSDETARAIRKELLSQGEVINQWRALRIARTEVVSASNIGTLAGAKSSSLPLEKYWIATQDDRTRETHAVIEDQNPKSMDEDFKVGDYMAECPGDPSLGAEEVINCRCALATEVKGYDNL